MSLSVAPAPAPVAEHPARWLREVLILTGRREPQRIITMPPGGLLTSSAVDRLASNVVPNGLIVAMEESQDGRRRHIAIVVQMRRLLGTVCMLGV